MRCRFEPGAERLARPEAADSRFDPAEAIFESEDRGLRRLKAGRLRRRSEIAFTLIEIMIAISIFAMVMIAIYASWSAILRGSRIGQDAAAEAQRTRVAVRALKEALASAQLFAANVRYYWFFADTTSSDFAQLSLVSRLPASFPGSGLFGDQIVRRISFTVERGPSGLNQLILRQTPLLEPPDTASTPYTVVLSPSVSMFQLEFWDTNKLEWMPEWLPTNQLPKLVRVWLKFGDPRQAITKAEDVAVETVLVSSLTIPRDLEVPAVRAGGLVPGGTPPPNNGQIPTSPVQK
jgi:prepilin-type N-terminal cleavage/methylation domain-containing protein